MRPRRLASVAAVVLAATFLLAPGDARATATRCRAAIVKANAAFVLARTKALQRCEDGKVRGKLPAGTACVTESKTAPALAKALAKLGASIAKGCGGRDRICGGINAADDDPLADIGWNIGTCSNFENGTCTNAITTCNDIPVCLACIDQAAVDQALGLYYGALLPTDPKSPDKTVRALNKCQATIGKFGAAFLGARVRAHAKCWGKVNKAGTGACPDARTSSATGKLRSKMAAAITRACQRPDRTDFLPPTIGFAASCPDNTPVGGASCAAAVDSLQGLADCVGCITTFKTDCPDRAAVPAFASPYPTECNPTPPVIIPECAAQRTVHLVGGNGGLAWFTLVWPLPVVIATPNANYSYDDVAKAAAVSGTAAPHPLYARLIDGHTLWAGIGSHLDPSVFVAGANQTHTSSPTTTRLTTGGTDVIAAGAALQSGLGAVLPVVTVGSAPYGTAPGAPLPAAVANADAAVGAVSTAASLTPEQEDDLRPSDVKLATWGISGGTPASLTAIARTLLFAANAFRLGLVSTVVLPAFSDDPHGTFTDVAATTARADGLTRVLESFYGELAANNERDCGHGNAPLSLADNTVLVVSGDTFKDPFNRSGWPDGTPGNANLLYVRSNGYLKPGWFGVLAPGSRTNFDPTTGDATTMVAASQSTAAAQLGILFAIARGDATAVAAVALDPYAGVVATTLP